MTHYAAMRPCGHAAMPLLPHSLPHTLAFAYLPRNRLRLQEEADVVAAAGFGIGAGHVEAAEGMHADEGAGAFAIHVEIADKKFFLGALDLFRIVGEDRAGESERRVVRDEERVIEIFRFDDREHRSENLFLRDRCA